MVSQSLDNPATQQAKAANREVAPDLEQGSANKTHSDPLAKLSSGYSIVRQFAALEINVAGIFKVIENSIRDPDAPLQRLTRETVKGEGISIDLQSKNAEATLKIADETGTTLHFCWGGVEQLRLSNAQGDKKYLEISIRSSTADSQKISLQSIDGCSVLSMDDTGVRICSLSERQAFISEKSRFLLESERSIGLSERASALINFITNGHLGSEIKATSPVELPGRIIPQEALVKYYTELNQMLEKAVRLLSPAVSFA